MPRPAGPARRPRGLGCSVPMSQPVVVAAASPAQRQDPHRVSWPQVVTWALTRGLVLGLAVRELGRGTLFSDPNLVWSWATRTPFAGEDAPALAEYPGAARVLALTGRLTDSPVTFGWAWVVTFLLVDLVLLAVLARAGRAGAWLWVLGGAALGPVVWLRYDLLVGLLAVGAVMLRDRRPGWSGWVLGMAVLLKLWPVVLVPALLLRVGWQRFGGGLAVTVGAGLLVEAVARGPSSVLTPLTYQTDRGVQVESLWATPTLVASRAEDPTQVWEFAFRAYQLQGADAGPATVVTIAVLAVAGVLLLVGTQRCHPFRLPAVRAQGASLMAVLAVATNAVFSPQYVMWFLPLVCLAVASTWRDRAARTGLSQATVGTAVALAALTQMVWPWGYDDLLLLEPWALTVLAVRNVLVLVLAALLAVGVWTSVAPARQPSASARNDRRT